MNTLLAILAVTALTACAPLYSHSTLGEDIGEVAIRIVGCPITLCFSELAMHEHRRKQAQEETDKIAYQENQRRYRAWYEALSSDEKDREDRKQAHQDAMMMQMLNMSNQNMNAAMDRMQNSFKPLPQPNYQIPQAPMPTYQHAPTYRPRQQTNCTSNVVGNQVYTNCY